MYLMGVDDMSLEDVRDILRKRLHAKHPTEFPMGTAGTSAAGLAAKIFYTRKTLASASVKCTQCDYEEDPVDDRLCLVLYEMSNKSESTGLWLKNLECHTSESAQIVLNHCKSLSVMIHLHHCSYLKSIQIISHSEKQLDLKKMIG